MTIQAFRDDEEIQTAIRRLLSGSIPEKNTTIDKLISEIDLVFQMLPDQHQDGRTIMDAGLYRFVRFNHRVVRSFWIGGFTAWEGYRAIAESEDLNEVDIAKFKEFVTSFEATIGNEQADDEPLPNGIPEPGFLPDKVVDPQGRAAAELAIIALGWAFLHEIRHIRHQQEGTSSGAFGTPESKRIEEFSCDEFATRFILENIESYANNNGDSASLVRRKRELGIYFALFALTLLAKDQWGETDSHPAVQERINAVSKIMGADRDATAEAIAHAAFATLRAIWPSAPMLFAKAV